MKSLIDTLGSYSSQRIDSKLSCTKSKNSILDSVDAGYEEVEQKESVEVVEPEIKSHKKSFRKDSIIASVDTGFGEVNTVIKDCPKSEFKKPLFKEDYLSVFTSETEKQLVRNNLGVIGAPEVTAMVKELVTKEIDSFITIDKVEELLEDLDFVDSKLNASADYNIPDKLFKL